MPLMSQSQVHGFCVRLTVSASPQSLIAVTKLEASFNITSYIKMFTWIELVAAARLRQAFLKSG